MTAWAASAPARPQDDQGPLVVLDVPFLAQSEALCGGAAAAMVMRFWGASQTRPEDFADLVVAARGGIETDDLVGELRGRGWRAFPFTARDGAAREHLERGRPVIALLQVAPGRFHYVVLAAWRDGRVLLHDPARGPFRVEDEAALRAAWAPAGDWALLLLPPEEGLATTAPPAGDALPAAPRDGCDALVDAAVARARDGETGDAERRLGAAASLCPSRGRPLRELAALRFREERWLDAAGLAERAVGLDSGDEHAWRLLGTSRYLGGQPDAALRAWNRVGEPEVDAVDVKGVERNRHDALIAYAGLPRERPLGPESLARAGRRLEDLPAAAATRTSYTPLGNGRVRVDAALVERPLIAPLRWLALGAAVDAATDRETSLRFDGLARRGDSLEVGGRWWERRPAAWLHARVPRGLGLPGLLDLELRWEEQPYRIAGDDAAPRVETRRRGALSASDWVTPGLRGRLGVAGERWSERGATASAFLELEQRLAGDRVALLAGGERWVSLEGGPGFTTGSARVALRSSATPRRLRATATLGVHAASVDAPPSAWPGAGVGRARPLLLRSRPLLDDGVVTGPALGRRLLHGSAELEVTVARPGPLRLGVAGFLDWARVRQGIAAPSREDLAAAGGGLRLHLSARRSLRVDAATDLDDGGWTVSAGWMLAWPR